MENRRDEYEGINIRTYMRQWYKRMQVQNSEINGLAGNGNDPRKPATNVFQPKLTTSCQ